MGSCVFCGSCQRVGQRGVHLHFADLRDGDRRKGAPAHRRRASPTWPRTPSSTSRSSSAARCSCARSPPPAATPARPTSTCWPRRSSTWPASGSTSWPRRATPTASWSPGPISRNMKQALLTTYEAMPEPKVVIAVGSCTLSGGPFWGSPEITEGLDTPAARGPVHPRLPAPPHLQPPRPADLLQVAGAPHPLLLRILGVDVACVGQGEGVDSSADASSLGGSGSGSSPAADSAASAVLASRPSTWP